MYVTCAVTMHMVVLGGANIVRILAELALGAPSGTFLGLPFLFAEGPSRAGTIHREQISLALALVLIGGPAWLFHWRAAQRAARTAELDRRSPLRSFYLQLVIFVTTLLVFFHAQQALGRALTEIIRPKESFGLPQGEPVPEIAASLSMVIVAAAAWWYHRRVALGDRVAVHVADDAASWRRLATYGLVLVGLFSLLLSAGTILTSLWDLAFPFPSGPFTPLDQFQFMLVFSLPALVTGVTLWLAQWRAVQRLVRAGTTESADERRSVARKTALYAILTVSALAVLSSLTFALIGLVRQMLGDPDPGMGRSLIAAAGGPLVTTAVFGAAWAYHRRVLEHETAFQTEIAKQADMRRLYYYLVSAIALAMLAIGTAGVIGVVGSYAMGYYTHESFETAAYISLVAVGLPFWAFHWSRVERHVWSTIDRERALDERRAGGRRGYLYLALLGGGLTVLIAGAATLYQTLNGMLGQDFGTRRVHDIWHLLVDTAIGAVVAGWHWRVLRGDRRAIGAATDAHAAAAPTLAFVVLVDGDDIAAARAKLEIALAGTGRVAERIERR